MKSVINWSGGEKILRVYVIIFISILGSLTKNYAQDNDRKALLTIDIQENLLNPHSKIHIDTTGIDVFILNLNKSISQFNDKNDLVVYVVNEWTNPFTNWFTGNVCKKGGTGVGLDKRLLIVNDRIYSKSKPNSLTNKELLNYLKDNKIKDVYVMGLLAEGCVKATVKGLIKEDFNVIIIEDALGSKSNKNKLKVIEYLQDNNIKMIKTGEDLRM